MTEREKAQAKREAERIKKHKAAQAAEVEEILTDWLAGNRESTVGMHRVRDILGTDGLRLGPTGLTVTTTQGLAVPAEDCRRAWPLIQRVYRGEGGVVLSEAQQARFGDFQLSRIEKDGTVVVGCHRFARWIVEHLAAQLERAQ
ncbi:hypothetical protein uan_119 [Pseudomonas phage UAntarctica]|nr:hypothetical protein uan_119 [Pseudomonas phage UAntarctica]